MKKAVFILCFISCTMVAYGQNAWIQDKGYSHLAFNTIPTYSKVYQSNGENWITTRPLVDNTLQLYFEYGMDNKYGIIFNAPYKMLQSGDQLNDNPSIPDNPVQAGNLNALGNLQIGFKYNLLGGKHLLTGQLLVELPTGQFDANTGLNTGLDATTIAPYIIYSTGSEKLYFNASVGFGIKNNNYSDDWRLNTELGFKPIKKLWIAGVIDIVSSTNNGNVVHPETLLQTGLYVNNQEYFSYGLKGSFDIYKGLGLSGAMFGAGSGNFVAKAPSGNLAVYYKW